MKRLLLILAFVFIGCASFAQARVINCDFTKEYGMVTVTKSLFGNVKIITDPKEFSDFRVRIIPKGNCCPDLFVKVVIGDPKQCGEWRFVKSEKDAWFTIKFVDDAEDFTIRFVSSNPGSAYEDFSY